MGLSRRYQRRGGWPRRGNNEQLEKSNKSPKPFRKKNTTYTIYEFMKAQRKRADYYTTLYMYEFLKAQRKKANRRVDPKGPKRC